MPAKKEKAARLSPKPDVLRELYLLSGNNCAMPGCNHLIIDAAGTVIGEICHIEAALPEGRRFSKEQSNEDRRALANLVLMCSLHHIQIDSKEHLNKWTVAKLQQVKRDHENKFRGVGDSLEKAFKTSIADSTDSLAPTKASTFARLESVVAGYVIENEHRAVRKKEVASYLKKMALVPEAERQFLLSVVRRAIKLDASTVSVDADDCVGAFKMSGKKVEKFGLALSRYDVGTFGEVGTIDGDKHHVMVNDPSDHLSWFDISNFCEETGINLEEFALHLNFGLLDSSSS